MFYSCWNKKYIFENVADLTNSIFFESVVFSNFMLITSLKVYTLPFDKHVTNIRSNFPTMRETNVKISHVRRRSPGFSISICLNYYAAIRLSSPPSHFINLFTFSIRSNNVKNYHETEPNNIECCISSSGKKQIIRCKMKQQPAQISHLFHRVQCQFEEQKSKTVEWLKQWPFANEMGKMPISIELLKTIMLYINR